LVETIGAEVRLSAALMGAHLRGFIFDPPAERDTPATPAAEAALAALEAVTALADADADPETA
jgi:hypothetical protein